MDFVSYKDLSKEIPKGTIGRTNGNLYRWLKKDTRFIVLDCANRFDENNIAFEVELKIFAYCNNKVHTILIMLENEISLLEKE